MELLRVTNLAKVLAGKRGKRVKAVKAVKAVVWIVRFLPACSNHVT